MLALKVIPVFSVRINLLDVAAFVSTTEMIANVSKSSGQ